MSIQYAKKDMALHFPTTLSQFGRTAAAAPAPGIFDRLAGAVKWVMDLPRRRAVLAELAQLSDHELSDIGLSRGEVGRVFDADFAAQRTAQRGSMGPAITV